jgi:hypothetical protein
MRATRMLAVLVVTMTAVGVLLLGAGARGADARAGSTRTVAADSCPVAGQCGVNAKTGCPTSGPIQVSAPEKCVSVPTTVFWVNGTAPSGGCTNILFVQIKLQPGISRYESVVYSTVGEGTRWWADPPTPLDQTGPATHAGQTFADGAASYTVPAGYVAWDVGDYAGPCLTTVSPDLAKGWAGWGVEGGAASGGGKGSGTMAISGPTHNLFHVSFSEVVTGTAGGAANYVVSGEQLGWTPRCASTLLTEQRRPGWIQWPTGTGPVHGTFRLVALFYSRNHLKHGICSYLVNSSTKHTYAHAARYWSNS